MKLNDFYKTLVAGLAGIIISGVPSYIMVSVKLARIEERQIAIEEKITSAISDNKTTVSEIRTDQNNLKTEVLRLKEGVQNHEYYLGDIANKLGIVRKKVQVGGVTVDE